jgi:general secretion pathway protein E
MAASPQIASVLGRRGRLELDELLAALVVDGYLAAEDAKQVRMGSRAGRSTVELHPLVLIANAKLPNQRDPGRAISLEALVEWLAGHAGLPYLKIDPMKVNVPMVTQVVSQAYARRHRILPVAATPGEVTFATAEPFDAAWAADLSHMLRRDVRRVVASPIDISRYLQEFYGVQRSIQLAQDAKANGGYDTSAILNFEQLVELGKGGKQSTPTTRAWCTWSTGCWQYAFDQRASDIHLEPRREPGVIRFRIDGVLHTVYQLPPAVMNAVTARIKLLARMDVAEKRRPQDGRIKTRSSCRRRGGAAPVHAAHRLRREAGDAHLRPRPAGEGPGAARLLRARDARAGAHGAAPARHRAGDRPHRLGQDHHAVLHAQAPRHAGGERVHGGGPDRDGRAPVQPDAGAARHRPGLRRGRARPDAPGPGHHHGGRDPRPGHRRDGGAGRAHRPPGVLHAAHQRRAQRGEPRCWTWACRPTSSTPRCCGVLAQRLVRTLCPYCKQEAAQDPHAWAALTHGWALPVPDKVCAPAGCLECRNTGFMGRTGIYEMMPISPRLRTLMSAQLELGSFGQAALAEGMRPLRISAAEQVARGLTTVQEVLAVLPPIDAPDASNPTDSSPSPDA